LKQQKETVTLTVAQAIIKYLSSQYIEIEGEKVRLCGGGFGIFGHGNVTCLGEALFENKEKLPLYRGQNEQGWGLLLQDMQRLICAVVLCFVLHRLAQELLTY
jgi:3D-(3,5/4)-trihydroxycyclohexane-1,2-dione acylhydrolase (decyclizing)